jgi:hypothetical protein
MGIPKKIIYINDGTKRVVSDFKRLNSLINCQEFPVPKFGDMIQSIEGSNFAAVMDLNMGYYHIK